MRTHAQIRRKYTSTVKLCGKWYAYLHVGVQTFSVVEHTTKKRAKRYADMLARALANVIEENRK